MNTHQNKLRSKININQKTLFFFLRYKKKIYNIQKQQKRMFLQYQKFQITSFKQYRLKILYQTQKSILFCLYKVISLQINIFLIQLNNVSSILLQMKQLIDLNSQIIPNKQQLILPQLKSKSISIPITKHHINYPSRYIQRKSIQYLRKSEDKKWIVNLQEIQKKSKIQPIIKPNPSHERKKILSQYQTVDLWKQKYHPDQLIQTRKRRKSNMHAQQAQPQQSNFLMNKKQQQQKILYKKTYKQSHCNLRLKLKNEKQKSIPDSVVIQRINQYKKLKKDQKLETILRKQIKQDYENIRKSYKSSLPVFDKPSPRLFNTKRVEVQYNPSKWESNNMYQQNLSQEHFL